jgi:hypothetical protein
MSHFDHDSDDLDLVSEVVRPNSSANAEIQIGKTKPTEDSGTSPSDAALEPALRRIGETNPMEQLGTSIAPSAHAEIVKTNPMEQLGTSIDPSAHAETVKTNPMERLGTSAAGPLSERQQVALRLLARGHGSTRVAEHLKVTRQTIARWKREPAFAAELNRRIAALTDAALRLRNGSRMHAFSLYRAELTQRQRSPR